MKPHSFLISLLVVMAVILGLLSFPSFGQSESPEPIKPDVHSPDVQMLYQEVRQLNQQIRQLESQVRSLESKVRSLEFSIR
jgi:TolA-binding protein